MSLLNLLKVHIIPYPNLFGIYLRVYHSPKLSHDIINMEQDITIQDIAALRLLMQDLPIDDQSSIDQAIEWLTTIREYPNMIVVRKLYNDVQYVLCYKIYLDADGTTKTRFISMNKAE